ncbi:hypothetical protein H6F43_01130 [Leptolyngbya sp. FACHB-36]|nr:hypothetical protein [Leptolyngbya sp. FACHB-36]
MLAQGAQSKTAIATPWKSAIAVFEATAHPGQSLWRSLRPILTERNHV